MKGDVVELFMRGACEHIIKIYHGRPLKHQDFVAGGAKF
jgi:hypothetical protein